MASLSDFTPGDKVFLIESAAALETPEMMIGVEVVRYDDTGNSGTVEVKVVYTNDIPGYEIGQRLDIDENVIAYERLTVQQLVDMCDAANPVTVPTAEDDDHADLAGEDDDTDEDAQDGDDD